MSEWELHESWSLFDYESIHAQQIVITKTAQPSCKEPLDRHNKPHDSQETCSFNAICGMLKEVKCSVKTYSAL